MRRTRLSAALLVLLAASLPRLAPAADIAALDSTAPWRVFLVCSQQERARRTIETTYSPAPPAAWTQPDFDDATWGRYADWQANIGGYGFTQNPASALLCLRNRFAVTDPAAARDLTLTIEYRGGAVVYINGQEIARDHLPAGKLEPQTPADELPPEAFTDPAGAPLSPADRPAEANLDRYEARIRKLTVKIPPAALRKGSNTLALELHAPKPGKIPANNRSEWSPVGLCDIKLTGSSGLQPYAEALKTTTISNATALDIIANTPGKRQAGFLWWGVTITPAGLTRANPFEPLAPMRAIAPRGGTTSAQIVVGAPGPIAGLKASLSPLTHGNTALPASAVRLAYAIQGEGKIFCDDLEPEPAKAASVQPVWVLVDVPRDQAPGWYTGTLTLTAGDKSAAVPVQIFVAGWTLTDPRNNATLVSMYQSPDTLAEHFKVKPWSDQHFALIEKSMTTMAPLGNDVLLVPVVLDNYLHHKTGLIRWVRKGDIYEPEYSAFERYLDLQTKVWGKPKIVTLSIWQHGFGTRSWFRGMKSDKIGPCMVTQLDPATGEMKPMQAPHFGEPGSEAFWKTAIEGVRRIIKSRGIDDRFLLLGEAFDSRPLQKHVDFFKTIEPEMRWQVYSHFDGGEPAAKNGKFICLGGLEVGFKIGPGHGGLPEFTRDYPKVTPTEFITAQAERVEIQDTSSPLSYRVVMRTSGSIARIGLDFWPAYEGRGGRRQSYYNSPPNEGWLWRGHVPSVTAAGPDGAVRTVRGQMLLEGLQESELYVALLHARQSAKPELAAKIDACFAARRQAAMVGKALSQAMISLDFNALAAREYALAAELANEPADGDWQTPPTGGTR